MKKVLLVLFVFFGMLSCTPKGGFQISDFKTNFKYDKLKTYKDNIHIQELVNSKKSILNDEQLKVVIQNSGIEFDTHDHNPVLLNGRMLDDIQVISVLGLIDGYCYKVYVMTYNKEGEFIDSEVLFQNGGDAGFYIESKGKFKNDRTFIRKTNNCEADEIEMGVYNHNCVKTETEVKIGEDGHISTKELSRKETNERVTD